MWILSKGEHCERRHVETPERGRSKEGKGGDSMQIVEGRISSIVQ